MSADERKGLPGLEMGVAVLLMVAGLLMSGVSLAQIRGEDRLEMAQATSPTQVSPPADSKAPAESKPGGTRPTTPAPEPARPDPAAQKEGAKAALPPAPAEKMAPPIKDSGSPK
jgi:hypothetical protein